MAGLLTFDADQPKAAQEEYLLKIPNLEILSAFNSLFIKHYFKTSTPKILIALQWLTLGDLNRANAWLQDNLLNSSPAFSFPKEVDTAEKVYQHYFAGLFSCFEILGLGKIFIEINSGLGRFNFDFFAPKQSIVWIFEFKVSKSQEEEALKAGAEVAINQIKSKNYQHLFEKNFKINRFITVEIAFYRNSLKVISEELSLN